MDPCIKCRPLCYSMCIFLVKVSNIHFLVEKNKLNKKKDAYNFSRLLTSQ